MRDAYVRRAGARSDRAGRLADGHGVEAAALEATGVYWHAPWEALTDAGIEAQLLNAHQVKAVAWPRDRVEAVRWYAHAANQGHSWAQEQLESSPVNSMRQDTTVVTRGDRRGPVRSSTGQPERGVGFDKSGPFCERGRFVQRRRREFRVIPKEL